MPGPPQGPPSIFLGVVFVTALEDAQVRVAKAQDAKDELHAEIMKKYGSQADLDMHCRGDTYGKKGGPRDLRRRYGTITKELRLAKSYLARMRNEEQQKPGYMQVMDEAAEKAEKESVTISVNGGPAHPVDSPEAKKELEKTVKKAMQTDLSGNEIKLPDGVKEVRKVTKRRVYEIEKFKLAINEKDLRAFTTLGFFERRNLVADKIRPLKREDLIIQTGDYDDGIEELMEVLAKASVILKAEDLKEAYLMARLAEVQ